jgi:hypothetical protein
MAINRTSPKKGKVVDIPDATITIGTPTAGAGQVSVAFTVASTPATGGPVQKYTAISNPGSITASGSTSPVVVTGLTNDTAYTFQVAAANATGRGPLSAASASATPVDPLSFVSIATVTVGAGGLGTISFTSIPSTYKHLQLRMYNRTDRSYSGNTVDAINIKLDGNVYTKLHRLGGDGASAASGVATDGFYTAQNGSGGTANSAWGAQIFDLLDYSNTNKNKVGRLLGGYDTNLGAGYMQLSSWLWATTTTPTSIDIYSVTGSSFYQYSSFALYGIKG